MDKPVHVVDKTSGARGWRVNVSRQCSHCKDGDASIAARKKGGRDPSFIVVGVVKCSSASGADANLTDESQIQLTNSYLFAHYYGHSSLSRSCWNAVCPGLRAAFEAKKLVLVPMGLCTIYEQHIQQCSNKRMRPALSSSFQKIGVRVVSRVADERVADAMDGFLIDMGYTPKSPLTLRFALVAQWGVGWKPTSACM